MRNVDAVYTVTLNKAAVNRSLGPPPLQLPRRRYSFPAAFSFAVTASDVSPNA